MWLCKLSGPRGSSTAQMILGTFLLPGFWCPFPDLVVPLAQLETSYTKWQCFAFCWGFWIRVKYNTCMRDKKSSPWFISDVPFSDWGLIHAGRATRRKANRTCVHGWECPHCTQATSKDVDWALTGPPVSLAEHPDQNPGCRKSVEPRLNFLCPLQGRPNHWISPFRETSRARITWRVLIGWERRRCHGGLGGASLLTTRRICAQCLKLTRGGLTGRLTGKKMFPVDSSCGSGKRSSYIYF